MLVNRLGYVSCNVTDLDMAVRLFSDSGQLQLNRRTEGRALLGSGQDHHWVELRQDPSAPAGLTRIALVVDPSVTLDEVEKVLIDENVPCTRGSSFVEDFIQEWVRFVDPDGTEIEIFRGMAGVAGAPQPKWAKLERLVHVAVSTAHWEASLDFYTRILGLGVSDFIEDTTAFLHAGDGAHHTMVLQRRPGPRALNHICFQTETFDDLMRARAIVRRAGLELRDDLLRHQTSGSIGFYFEALPPGLGIEFCFEHSSVVPGNHQPRTFVRTIQAKDVYEPPTGY